MRLSHLSRSLKSGALEVFSQCPGTSALTLAALFLVCEHQRQSRLLLVDALLINYENQGHFNTKRRTLKTKQLGESPPPPVFPWHAELGGLLGGIYIKWNI